MHFINLFCYMQLLNAFLHVSYIYDSGNNKLCHFLFIVIKKVTGVLHVLLVLFEG